MKDVVNNIINKANKKYYDNTLSLFDEKEFENVENEEQNITHSFINFYKNMNNPRIPNYKLLDLVNQLRIQITYDEEINITSSQSMIEFNLTSYDNIGNIVYNYDN